MTDFHRAIESKLSQLMGKDVTVTPKAALCLHKLAESEPTFYSWHLKLLSIIFKVSPEIWDILQEIDECFAQFDFEYLDAEVKHYFIEQAASEYAAYTTHDTITDFDDFLTTFFVGQPDPGGLAVVYDSPIPTKLRPIQTCVTVDHLIWLLFYVLYLGTYESDLAVAILSMSERGLVFGRINRRYLDGLERILLRTEPETAQQLPEPPPVETEPTVEEWPGESYEEWFSDEPPEDCLLEGGPLEYEALRSLLIEACTPIDDVFN